MPVIGDIMSKRIVTISPDATFHEAAKILCENDLGGAPVVATTGELVGFISETGLIDMLFDAEARQAAVAVHMRRDVIIVRAGDSLAEAARLLSLYGIRSLPVLEDGRLVGIVNRRDLMNYVLRTDELLTDPLIELIPSLAPMT